MMCADYVYPANLPIHSNLLGLIIGVIVALIFLVVFIPIAIILSIFCCIGFCMELLPPDPVDVAIDNRPQPVHVIALNHYDHCLLNIFTHSTLAIKPLSSLMHAYSYTTM